MVAVAVQVAVNGVLGLETVMGFTLDVFTTIGRNGEFTVSIGGEVAIFCDRVEV